MSKLIDTAISPSDLVPRLKDQGYDRERLSSRRHWMERKAGVKLPNISNFTIDPELMRGNIENPIGAAQVPLGIAGPVVIHGENAEGSFLIPMATTEGALVRSYERGMVAITHAGGATAAVIGDENQTAPTFFFEDVACASRFDDWVRCHLGEMRDVVSATTSHGALNNATCYQVGRQTILNLGFSTGDAQGMNMIVKATDAVCRWIEKNYVGVKYLLFSGMCSEKRPSGFLLARGKGKRVTAGCLLPPVVLRMVLHTTAEELFRVWQSTVVGQMQAGAIGYSAHVANGLAAIFIATGQDVANVVNAACATTNFELHKEGLYASITLPALSVGTVGGGTGLPTQREALEMLGCYGSGKAKKFAEIVAVALLGGEISMGAAIGSGEFVGAHELYGRNRPK